MKRIFTLLFATMLAGQAWAEDFTVGNLTYTVTGANTVSVTAADTDIESDFEIPSTVENGGVTYTVTGIGNQAFDWCSGLHTIAIPSSVTTIGNNIFKSCSYITAVNVDAGNTAFSSENGVLFNKNKTTLIYYPSRKEGAYTIPNTVTTIGDGAFHYCADRLTAVTIQNSVTTIGASAFDWCYALTSITIPNSVTSIGNGAFKNCYALESVTMSNSITSISEELFSGCAFTSIEIPNGVTRIESYAFHATDLTSLIIPNTVKTIGERAFERCSDLETIVIPKSVDSIGVAAFTGDSKLTIYCEAESQPDGWNAYWNWDDRPVEWGYNPNAKMWKVTLSSNNSAYGSVSGGGTVKDSTSVTITATPKSGYNFVKWSNGLTTATATIKVTSDTTLVAEFEEKPTWTVTLSSNNSTYGSVSGGGTVKDSSSVTITASPAEGYKFVKWSNGLTNATATIKVTSDTTLVAEFAEVDKFWTFSLSENNSEYGSLGWSYKTQDKVTLDDGSTAYVNGAHITISAEPRFGYRFVKWSNGLTNATETITITSDTVIVAEFEEIGFTVELLYYYFTSDTTVEVVRLNDKEITSVIIPETVEIDDKTYSVTSIGRSVFESCSELTSVTIPNTVKSIGSRAFYDCEKLASINIPEQVTTIGTSAFYACDELTSITIPKSVSKIESGAFDECDKLTGIIVDSSNMYYSSENGVLFNKDKTELIRCPGGVTGAYTIPDGVTNIGWSAFNSCRELTSIIIPNTVISIEYYAFDNTGITSITIPNSVTKIDGCAFQYCSYLTFVVIPNSVTTIYGGAFDGCRSATIYCESEEKPAGWRNNWNPENRPVVWGFDPSMKIFKVALSANSVWRGNVEGPTSAVEGSKITIVATPKEGYRFEKWSNGLTTDTAIITVTSDTTIMAEFVSEQAPAGNQHYEITSNTTVRVVNYDGYEMREIIIPETVEIDSITYTVTSIGEKAFKDCYYLSSVTIPNTVKDIEDWAFWRCTSLKSVTIPNSVERILYGAFEDCSGLESITIPESVTTFENCVFENCDGLTSITIPESITSIPYGTFMSCDNLTTISLPNTIIDIDESAFRNCNKLEYNEYDNALYLGNAENPYAALIKVKSTDITDCEINSNCKVITEDAFKDCAGLTSITVPNSVQGISCGAFSGCSSLESITLPFVGDKRHSFTDARQYPFGYIFGYGEYDGGVETWQMFYDKDNTSYVSTIYYVPSSLKSVTLTDCDYIQYDAFYECGNLTSITIPTSVTQIERGAMPGGNNLTIYCALKAAPRGWDSDWNSYNRPVVWGNVDVVDANNVDGDFAYRIIDDTYVEIIDYVGVETEIVIPSTITKSGVEYTVTRIGDNAFNSYKDMKSVIIPNTVTSIGNRAFANCYNLTSVSIPNSVTTIGSFTFENCIGLKSVDIPNSVTTIGNSTFYNCYNLTSVEIPNSITGISNNMFKECSSLTTITIPNSVTNIGNSAFSGCKSLVSVNIPNTVTRIGEWAFNNSGLTYIAIPNSVTRIEGWAFDGCDNLTAAAIPNSVTSMDWIIFRDCPNLTIYCETASKPEGWADYWNPDSLPVEWGFNIKSIFIVAIKANDNDCGRVKGGGVVVGSSSTVNISASPFIDYHFARWSDNNTDNPRTLTVTSDTSLTALFEAHIVVTDSAVAATCTETGLTEGSHCSVCGRVIVEQEIIPMLEDNTAITESAASKVNIYAHHNTIVVENATDEIRVYDAMGKLICRDVACRVRTEITINGTGVYIVKTGNVVKRVMVN